MIASASCDEQNRSMNRPPQAGTTNDLGLAGVREFMSEVERECTRRGLRLTPLRADVLRLVAASDRPIKAYELLDRIRASRATSAPPTAYRALDFLVEHGFVHKLESINAYVRCHHPAERHEAMFLICNRCLRTIEAEDERPLRLLKEGADAIGFSPNAQILEIHGLCPDCAASQP